MNEVKFALHCICGASWTGIIEARPSVEIEEIWWEAHTGPGHGQCNSKTAQRKRAAQEKLFDKV